MTKQNILSELNIKISSNLLMYKDYLRENPNRLNKRDYVQGRIDAYEDALKLITDYYNK